MNISIFGLGYVGCVSAGCLAKSGHTVIGVDVVKEKVDLINQGLPTIVEDEIDVIIKEAHESSKLSATVDHRLAVLETDVSIICVGTPNEKNGMLNLNFIYETAQNIGKTLKSKSEFHLIVIRSTVAPGTNAKVTEIIADKSGRRSDEDFVVVSNPEFLREGSAVNDYYNPPCTVVGSNSEKGIQILKNIYSDINGQFVHTDIGVAEMIKYINNSYHALKIAFANEVGNICKELNINSHELMKLFVMDTKLNISPAYFKPGMAFGGSCLPKDLRGLTSIANSKFIQVPILEAVERSNQIQKKNALDMVLRQGRRSIGVIGLAFKKGTDDLRLSPAVELVENLLGKGYNVKIFDKNVIVSRLFGKNKSYIDDHLPHLSELLVDDLEKVIEETEIIVVNHNLEELYSYNTLLKSKIVLDNTGLLQKIDAVFFEQIV